MARPAAADEVLVVGRVTAVFGVKGEVRVHSLTDPPDNLRKYRPWLLGADGEDWLEHSPSAVRRHGKGLLARFDGVEDRDRAAALVGRQIAIRRSQLPAADEDEYYWIDLIGLDVVTIDGRALGAVDHLMETGANDVLVVRGERERLIPFLREQVVKEVDREARRIVVDWDPEF
ncbi:MAG: ribosome maturation factor RimM [Planctomycetes bacterium]|nr:ribosome maturation factor RimM [Planctomycetota bacterium]